MGTHQTTQERARDVAHYLLRSLLDELPTQDPATAGLLYKQSIEAWLLDFDQQTKGRHIPAHKLVRLANDWAVEFFADNFQQTNHQLLDLVHWGFEFSRALLITKGHFRGHGEVEITPAITWLCQAVLIRSPGSKTRSYGRRIYRFGTSVADIYPNQRRNRLILRPYTIITGQLCAGNQSL